VDIGGSKIALGVSDHAGHLHATRRLGPPAAAPATLQTLIAEARALLDGLGVDAPEAIGIAAPGPLDRARGRITDPPNLPGWRDVPVVDALSDAFGAPAFLENDANAAALAEWQFGAGRGAQRVVYLTMSTGVGAGLVLDGRLYRGRGDHAGEIGHAPVEWEGRACACGLRGCLEAYVGGRAWTERLRAEVPREGRLAQLAGAPERVTPEHVIRAAGEGDAFALAELDAFTDWLARGLVLVAFAYAPDVIVLGTIASAAGERLCLAPLRQRVREHLWPGIARGLRIEASALWPDRTSLAGVCAALEGRRGAGTALRGA
jgi:glucokinase